MNLRPHGKHRAIDRVHALEAENNELACRVVTLAGENDELQRQFNEAAVTISGLLDDSERQVAAIRRLQDQVIRDAAEKQRLRQALIQARPRITAIPAQAARPTEPDSIPLHLAPHAA